MSWEIKLEDNLMYLKYFNWHETSDHIQQSSEPNEIDLIEIKKIT